MEITYYGGKLDSNPDTPLPYIMDCDPDPNPDSGPGAPVKCLFTSSRYKPYTQVVFLDDIGANLKSARKLGMSTIKVTEVGQAVRELEQILDTKLSLNSKL